MTRLVWDQTGERLYETGSDRAVLYLEDEHGAYPKGVAWNGFIGITESPSGAEETKLYANNSEYVAFRSNEEFGGTITAYTVPDDFKQCDGSLELVPGMSIGQQTRKRFALCYRTIIGNDTETNEHGYKLHVVYKATVSPSEKQYTSINDSPEAVELSYEFSCGKVDVTGAKPIAHLEFDSTKLSKKAWKALEDKLYGDDSTGAAQLPLPDELKQIITEAGSDM